MFGHFRLSHKTKLFLECSLIYQTFVWCLQALHLWTETGQSVVEAGLQRPGDRWCWHRPPSGRQSKGHRFKTITAHCSENIIITLIFCILIAIINHQQCKVWPQAKLRGLMKYRCPNLLIFAWIPWNLSFHYIKFKEKVIFCYYCKGTHFTKYD